MTTPNKLIRIGPIALTTTTTTNLINPPTLTGGVNVPGTNTYLIIRHIRVGNKTGSAASFATWIGLTGANTAGTEGPFMGAASGGALTQGVAVAGNSYVDYYGQMRLDVADFLVGGAGTATALTMLVEAELGIA